MNPNGAKDLTSLAAALSPVAPSAREVLITTVPYYQSQFREDRAECVSAARLATDGIDAAVAAEHINAPASWLEATGLKPPTAPRGEPCAREECQNDLASVEGLTDASRRARDQSDTARRPSLVRAHRDLRETLTAMLRLTCDWNIRGTDMVAVRMIEHQRRALEVMADLIDSLLTIAEPETAQQPARLIDLASRPGGRNLREVSATPALHAAEWSAAWSMAFSVDLPEVPVAVGPASRTLRVLLIDENPAVLGALRIYLLCAGYRVLAAANADQALDRARMARMSTSFIDIIIADFDLTGDDGGLAVINKTRQLLGYNVPAVLLTTQTFIEMGQPALVADVSLLRKPVNVDELNTLIGEVLKRQRRSRLAQLRIASARPGHDELNPEVVC